jgi:hypothetical protein
VPGRDEPKTIEEAQRELERLRREIERSRENADRLRDDIVTSNRGPDEWLVTFADPIRAQSAIDHFTSNAYDLILPDTELQCGPFRAFSASGPVARIGSRTPQCLESAGTAQRFRTRRAQKRLSASDISSDIAAAKLAKAGNILKADD